MRSNYDYHCILPPIMEKGTPIISESADRAFKAKLYRAELEAQIFAKRESERRRKEEDAAEEEKLLKKIKIQREKERKAYLQEIAAIKQNKMENYKRRQKEITRRLEEIQIEEARQRDEEEARRKRILCELMYSPDCCEPRFNNGFPPPHFLERPWNYWSHGDYGTWFRLWRSSMEEIYLRAPIHQLAEINRELDAEQIKLHEIMRHRLINRK